MNTCYCVSDMIPLPPVYFANLMLPKTQKEKMRNDLCSGLKQAGRKQFHIGTSPLGPVSWTSLQGLPESYIPRQADWDDLNVWENSLCSSYKISRIIITGHDILSLALFLQFSHFKSDMRKRQNLRKWIRNLFLLIQISPIPYLTHEGLHREVYQEFQPSYDIFRRSSAKGCSDHRFRAPPAYTAQLPTLHRHRANNQYRTANQIQPTLNVSSNAQTTNAQSPIQVLTELKVA